MNSEGPVKASVEGHVVTKALNIMFESPVVPGGPVTQHTDIELMSMFN